MADDSESQAERLMAALRAGRIDDLNPAAEAFERLARGQAVDPDAPPEHLEPCDKEVWSFMALLNQKPPRDPLGDAVEQLDRELDAPLGLGQCVAEPGRNGQTDSVEQSPGPCRRPNPDAHLHSLNDAAQLTGVSRSTLEELYASGLIQRYTKSGRPGGDRLVDVREVKEALRVPDASPSQRETVDRILAELTQPGSSGE